MPRRRLTFPASHQLSSHGSVRKLAPTMPPPARAERCLCSGSIRSPGSQAYEAALANTFLVVAGPTPAGTAMFVTLGENGSNSAYGKAKAYASGNVANGYTNTTPNRYPHSQPAVRIVYICARHSPVLSLLHQFLPKPYPRYAATTNNPRIVRAESASQHKSVEHVSSKSVLPPGGGSRRA